MTDSSNQTETPQPFSRRHLLKGGMATSLAAALLPGCSGPSESGGGSGPSGSAAWSPIFTIKPRVPIKGVATPASQIGDPVLVTEKGAERLGRRKLEVISV